MVSIRQKAEQIVPSWPAIDYPYLYSASTKNIPDKIFTVQLTGFDLLDGTPYPSRSGDIVYSFADNFTKVWRNHTTKFGFIAEYSGKNNFDQITVSNTPGSTNNQNGKFVFSDTRGLSAPNGQCPLGTSGVAAANSALGLFDTYGEIGQRSYTLYRSWMYEGFAQDQWHVSPNLVIEAGRGTRNQITGPGFQSYNMAVNKSWVLVPGHESTALTFRAEAFNLANHPTADNPDTNYTSGTFGRSTTKGQTYGADRQLQFSLRASS